MLVTSSRLTNCPVMSLHVGDEIARVVSPIIDPNDLKIVAFELNGPLVGRDAGTILETRDVREFSDIGMIVDSIDVFVNPGDVIRLDEVRKINFSLVGKKVVTKKGTKLGKVIDYTVNSDDFMIQQMTVQRPILKAFVDPELLIGRSEVVSVDDDKVIVRDEEAKIKEHAAEDFTPSFVNPFRKQPLAQAESQTLDEPDTE
ncbi:hypothetical protein IJJ18_02110 [Candidatus Saccharibacteria bacterium]|nr:hypothetical protein [Candidatus Saccharibacteria bacterium]